MKLIYHKQNNSGSTSPFDSALLRVSNGANPLYLASPYIGLGFLNRIVGNTHDWKLLSDVEAWLSAGNRKQRALCWQFILENLDRIKHVPDLHAKVAIGNNLLFLGSANFTDKGVLGRDELSVLIDDQETVQESLDWFNVLWNSASSPAIEEGDELLQALDELKWTVPRSRIRLSSSAVKVKSILATSRRPVGFDIASTFAKSSIDESDKLLPLEDAYKSQSDEWFGSNHAFTYQELLLKIKSRTQHFSHEELWSLVIRETVNHWYGGLISDGFDRYIYINGKFEKWEPSKLTLITKIDNILKFVIKKMEVAPSISYLPIEDDWLKAGLPEHQIFTIVNLLISIGLLVEIDNPGEIEMYSLDAEFVWPKRWYKFSNARIEFQNKIQNLKSQHAVNDDDSSDYENEFQSSSDFISNLEAIKTLKKVDPKIKDLGYRDLSNELYSKSKAFGISHFELKEIRDKDLLACFDVIESKLFDLRLSDVQESIGKINNKYTSKNLFAAFNDLLYGPFMRNNSLSKTKPRYDNRVVLSKDWLAKEHLNLYPLAKQKWLDLLKKSSNN